MNITKLFALLQNSDSIKVARLPRAMLLTLLVTACTSQPLNKAGDFGALRTGDVTANRADSKKEFGGESSGFVEVKRFSEAPTVSLKGFSAGEEASNIEDKLVFAESEVRLNIKDLPLPDFIYEVFGKQLDVGYLVEPALTEKKDLVTLNMVEALSPRELYRTARSVLSEYGVAISQEEGFLKFRLDRDASKSTIPLIVSGKALPDVPNSHRPVFMVVPLKVVRNSSVSGWLASLFKGSGLIIKDDIQRNSVILQGPLDIVKQAVGAVAYLDQPLLKGQHSLVITPAFTAPDVIAMDLEKVLASEGYSVSSRPSTGAVVIFPLESQDALLVFANDQSTINHVKSWVEILDSRKQAEIANGIFSYQAQNVTAKHIAELLSQLSGDATVDAKEATREGGGLSSGNSDGAVMGIPYGSGSLVVDESRNVLFYKGSGQEWLKIQQAIAEIDLQVPSVLVEVLLAEVTLNSQETVGVEWMFSGDGVAGTDLVGKTLGGLSLGGQGLSLTFDSAGQTRAIINAFAKNDRAVIRSSPKILVKSGGEASIEVGNEIPVITSNSQSTGDGDAPVIQNIQYRKTGVLLKIQPVVQASGLVDIHISQELSEEQITQQSSTGSPIILNRKLETEITLKDGGSVLIGGLISTSKTKGVVEVPGLSKIPLLGRLFRTESEIESRTELLVLLIPYVINQQSEASRLTENLKRHLGLAEKSDFAHTKSKK